MLGELQQPHGIAPLSTAGKMLAQAIINQLTLLAERVYPESQCGSDRTVELLTRCLQSDRYSRNAKVLKILCTFYWYPSTAWLQEFHDYAIS